MNTTREAGAIAAVPSWFGHSTRPLRRLLSLSQHEASFRKRGFTASIGSKRLALESVGETFIGGYNLALVADRPNDLLQHIDTVPASRRGFAVEGAAMGCAIADVLPFRKPSFAEHVRMYAREFSYLTHVGAGWALARAPWRLTRILAPLDPVHYWLVYDGVGFHDTYFYHRRVLAGWRRKPPSSYAARAYDQGIGRALWFVAGGSAAGAVELIGGFAAARRGDLWSGLGLAMTYAGPVEESEITTVFAAAGMHRLVLAQGVAFACEARARAQHVPAHTELAANVVSRASADELSNLVRRARAGLSGGDADTPPYEIWRQKVVAEMSPMLERRS